MLLWLLLLVLQIGDVAIVAGAVVAGASVAVVTRAVVAPLLSTFKPATNVTF